MTALVVTISDTFEPISKMLMSTWFTSMVLNSFTHIKTKFLWNNTQKVSLIACSDVP